MRVGSFPADDWGIGVERIGARRLVVRGLGADEVLPSRDHVFGVELTAVDWGLVVPLDTLTQLEGDLQAVAADFPGLREVGFDF